MAIPWAIGDDVLPPSSRKETALVKGAAVSAGILTALNLPKLMASAGVTPTLQVLYVPDYITPQNRINATIKLAKELENVFPHFIISLAVAEGSFEDIEGTRAHFDGGSLNQKTLAKKIAAFRVDFQVAVAHLARAVCYHTPKPVSYTHLRAHET